MLGIEQLMKNEARSSAVYSDNYPVKVGQTDSIGGLGCHSQKLKGCQRKDTKDSRSTSLGHRTDSMEGKESKRPLRQAVYKGVVHSK